MDKAHVLIDASELGALLAVRENVAVLDVRWRLGDPNGRQHYRDGHVPGAVFVDLETELAAQPSPELGRHPLPTLEDLQAAARRWGINAGDLVVVYDDIGSTSAARAWWLLRWAGIGTARQATVRILDGGLGAWQSAGGELETGEDEVRAGNIVLPAAGSMPTVDADGAAGIVAEGALLDARAGERYRGDVEPIDPRAGHIPGAVSAPTTENLDEDGRFLSAEDLRERFVGMVGDADRVAAYCGSGVTAAHQVVALAIAGYDAALYPGSWSQWSSDPDRPAVTGDSPGNAIRA